MLKGFYYEERRWSNWLEFAMFVEKNRWQVIKSPEPVGRLASAQNIDNYQTYNASAFKQRVEVSGSVYVHDASGQGGS